MIYDAGESNLDNLNAVVERVTADLTKHADKFDFIAVRGCSGIVVGVPVSLAINKPLVIVRKPDESSHEYGIGRTFVNWRHCRGRWLFLDDFISSGRTLAAVTDEIKTHYPNSCEYVGSYLYQNEDFPFMWEPAKGGGGRRPKEAVAA